MSEADDRVTKLFTKECHHRNISVMFIVQNLFGKKKEQRTISLNSHYLVVFKNPRDASQMTHQHGHFRFHYTQYQQHGHFTTSNINNTNISLQAIPAARTFHYKQYQQHGHFTTSNTNSLGISLQAIPTARTFHYKQYGNTNRK